jgi:hypothetical protein
MRGGMVRRESDQAVVEHSAVNQGCSSDHARVCGRGISTAAKNAEGYKRDEQLQHISALTIANIPLNRLNIEPYPDQT